MKIIKTMEAKKRNYFDIKRQLNILSKLFFCLLFSQVFSQEKPISYIVKSKDDIAKIARKFKVSELDIYQLNPDAQNGISEKMVLIIPNKKNKSTAVENTKSKQAKATTTHIVSSKETIYGILKKYNINEQNLFDANPKLEQGGLKIGDTLVITKITDVKETNKKEKVNGTQKIYHVVLQKDTKYGIAKKYGITLQELEKNNPEIVESLPIGFRLYIKNENSNPIENSVVVATPKNKPNPSNATIKTIDYIVQPKETLYSLSKNAGMSQEDFLSLNPDLKEGVKIGSTIKMPSDKLVIKKEKTKENTEIVVEKTIATSIENKTKNNELRKNSERKKLVLLLPFNSSEKENDSVKAPINKKFLNMTLDFYAGASMAIDSVKTLGLPIDIAIYDSKENKNSSDVPTLISAHNLKEASAIIGPFYQTNAEQTAELLQDYEVPVISPLSKEPGKPLTNLYCSVPSNDKVKDAMFAFMRAQNGNIIAAVDRKKVSVLDYLKKFQPEVPLVPFTDKGGLSMETIKNSFLPNVTNYVVMETESTWMIKSITNTMLAASTKYKVQLVILEPNPTLDFEEINFSSLIKLKMMYPSVDFEDESTLHTKFANKYKRLYASEPNEFALRGFDVTFDTVQRLFQEDSFEKTVSSFTSQQIANKFDYFKTETNGYANKGVFILYYDSDYTIKKAN